ncbi:Retrotransposable element Tf2 155 kDa protein type 1 [Papilio machaon]|uniref:RNA-directed DNA polymerase n=1 Tax=Papilio machaon TaxID=76193 RepID=A0A0N1PG61_PAPMA|nr:Retrotransposable element Tf2 155 kDa protein type 1 [Papilio machaon]
MSDKYCSKRPYRCTNEDRSEIENQISKLLEKNLIEESYSPFAAPVTLAYKKEDGRKTRLCIDFRELNKIVVPQSQPFPLIEDLVVKTVNCKYFSTFDVNSAFWSIPLKIQDRYKTAFVTQEGHYQWTCLPFGLKTAPAIFQRILSNIIRKHGLSNFAVNFIDDILVFSKTFEEHILHVSRLLEAILAEGFRLKFSKCSFANNQAKYLGHIIENNTVRPLKDYLTAVRDFPIPETRKQVRQFLGKVNFHHKFIPYSAIILDPLHNLLRKDVKFIWSEKCQESFDKIKRLLCSKPILNIFDSELPIIIYTDASAKGIGAVLKQTDENGVNKTIAYFSKKLTEAQKKKKAVYLECLAIKEAVKYWQHWLMGKEFTVFTDHKPLENMNIKARTDEELGDLTYYLSQYNFKIKYNPGNLNQEADCLSRNPVLEPDENSEDFLKVVNIITLEDIKNDQYTNLDLKNEKHILEKEIYYKKSKGKKKIILSEELSKTLIKDVHNIYCHIGRTQLMNKITPFYTAKNIIANIKQICNECEVCIKNKSRRKPKYGLMSHLGPATRPFEIVSIDTIGGFGGSRSTKKYLHLLVDHFTRYAYILTSRNQCSNDFIKLLRNVTDNYKIDIVLTDQYPGINSKEFKEFLKKENISLVFTAVDSPFSNGLNERLNQTLVNKIRCKINEKERKTAWTTIARICVDKYNETEHTVTKFAPKYLLEGENVSILPIELKSKFTEQHLENDRKLALENTLKSHNYNKRIFDSHREYYKLEIGDTVYVENGNRLNRKKLDELRVGPYKILKKISNTIYEVDTGHNKVESNFYHITKLTPVIVVR